MPIVKNKYDFPWLPPNPCLDTAMIPSAVAIIAAIFSEIIATPCCKCESEIASIAKSTTRILETIENKRYFNVFLYLVPLLNFFIKIPSIRLNILIFIY